jgi:hypothetical protein
MICNHDNIYNDFTYNDLIYNDNTPNLWLKFKICNVSLINGISKVIIS